VKIQKCTFGIGDRFSHQGQAQLRAILNARQAGIDVYPVWNKSNREHSIIKSNPMTFGPRLMQPLLR
jgi:tagaturonate epimerase